MSRKLLARIRLWVRVVLHPLRMEREMDVELRFHIEAHCEQLVRQGLPREEAERRARAEFGALAGIKESCRDARGTNLVESLWQDSLHGLRLLRRNAVFGCVAISTLALGIGATTAVFSLVNAVLLRALPYGNAGRLVFLYEPVTHISGVPLEAWAPYNGDFYDWQRQSRSFSRMAMFTSNSVNLTADNVSTRVNGSRVTGDFFRTLGVGAELGRVVDERDDEPAQARVVVISYRLWQSRFGGDRHVIGRELTLNARPYRIIGVMPAGFAFPHGTESLETTGKRTDLWIPLALTPEQRVARDQAPGDTIALLRPGVPPESAAAELNAITAPLDRLHPKDLQGSHVVVRPMEAAVTGISRRPLLIFLGAVGLVLLIACTNLAGLLVARGQRRAAEMGLRAALGASRGRLVRQLLSESLWLAIPGGALGVLAAVTIVQLLVRLHPVNIPRLEETSIDGRMLLFTIGVSLASAIFTGIFPGWSASRSDPIEALKAGGRSIRSASGRLGRALIVAEIALTVVLLAGAGLLIRSFARLASVDKGFTPSATVTMGVQLDWRYNSRERHNEFFHALLDRIGALPGVASAAAANHLPLDGGQSLDLIEVEGHGFDPKTSFESRLVTPRYFAAMGIPLLEGRDFNESDTTGGAPVIIVSRSFARHYFPGTSALGRRVHTTGWRTIVGVVADVRQFQLDAAPPMQFYLPLWQIGLGAVSVVARTRVPPETIAVGMRQVLRGLDPNMAPSEIHTMNQLVSEAMLERRFEMYLLTAFALIAMFLSMIGLYALLAYWVERRNGEMGIRIALGARSSNVMSLILRQGAALSLAGIGLGLMGAWAASRAMAGLLFETAPLDGPAFAAAAVLFGVVALAACYVPARRATRVDPITALRQE
jgi:predicted permease